MYRQPPGLLYYDLAFTHLTSLTVAVTLDGNLKAWTSIVCVVLDSTYHPIGVPQMNVS